MLCCPVCGEALRLEGKAARCARGHSFDRAKEGYVNLLRSNRSGEHIGDDKIAARSRRDFLNKGYYAPLRDALVERLADKKGSLLDICCGEGYYTAALGQNPNLEVYGFDISKEMVRLAAKRGGATYFVANLAAIPMADGCVDYAVHLFAPFHEPEFARVLAPHGRLYTVIPGARHLWGLKAALYDHPYPNDEQLPMTSVFTLHNKWRVHAHITLTCAEDIAAVLRMTPYYFHTREQDKAKLAGRERLETEIEFIIAEYGRASSF